MIDLNTLEANQFPAKLLLVSKIVTHLSIVIKLKELDDII